MDRNSKILVTGAQGMVGKNLVEELIKREFKSLILVDRNNLDLTDRQKTINFFERQKPEYVFHLASRVGGIKDNLNNPMEFLRDNLLINTNVIDASFLCKSKKLINLSSATIYSHTIGVPSEKDLFKEPVEEDNEAYALSKIFGLKLCEYYNKEYNTNFLSLVSPNIFGKYANFDPTKSNVVAALIKRFHEAKENNFSQVDVWGSGKAIREFIYAKDLAAILIEAMNNLDKDDTFEGRLNCGFQSDFSIKEIAETVKKVVNFKGKIFFDTSKPEGLPRRSLDSSKIKPNLKEIIQTSLEDGLKSTYQYFLEFSK